ncbi:vesicular glutamate transporter 3-like isoform X2 [Planococcus citri]
MGGQVVSIAIVEMVSKKSDSSNNQTTSTKQPTFQWNSLTVGIILNTFYYGSLFSPLGGYWSSRFGGVATFGISMMLAGLLVFLTPFSLSNHFYLFLLVRILVGVLESFCNASNAEIFTRWFPKQERPIFMACVINGLYFGTAVTSPFCGFLIHKWGWPMAFYGAAFCICWSLLWLFLVQTDPLKDKWISEIERNHILQGTENKIKKTEPFQYRNIFSSTPFWALSLSKFAFGGGVTFIVAYFPTYIKDAAQTNINMTGVLSSIPNFVNILIIPIASLLMTHWQNHSKLKDTMIHKIILSTGFISASSLFVVIAFANSFTISMICFVLIKIILSNNKVILELITVSMAPNHSSIISGLSLFWQTIGSIVTQIFIGISVKNHKLEEWNSCFLWAAGVLVIIALIFAMYGSSEPQSWSNSQTDTIDWKF